jgi:hypothetical protein
VLALSNKVAKRERERRKWEPETSLEEPSGAARRGESVALPVGRSGGGGCSEEGFDKRVEPIGANL